MSIQNQGKEKKDNEEYSKNFARIPNMLFVSYKHLSKEEKYLYCTLKSIYWDARPRFASLREIGEHTGFSKSALAKMLPRLDACGLITAEITKERSKNSKETGHAKYKICILDIWELNRKYFESSPEEREKLDPSAQIVHETDNVKPPSVHETDRSVHQTDKSVHETDNSGRFHGQSQARIERAKDNNKDLLKNNNKEKNSFPKLTNAIAPKITTKDLLTIQELRSYIQSHTHDNMRYCLKQLLLVYQEAKMQSLEQFQPFVIFGVSKARNGLLSGRGAIDIMIGHLEQTLGVQVPMNE